MSYDARHSGLQQVTKRLFLLDHNYYSYSGFRVDCKIPKGVLYYMGPHLKDISSYSESICNYCKMPTGMPNKSD